MESSEEPHLNGGPKKCPTYGGIAKRRTTNRALKEARRMIPLYSHLLYFLVYVEDRPWSKVVDYHKPNQMEATFEASVPNTVFSTEYINTYLTLSMQLFIWKIIFFYNNKKTP